MYGFCHPYLFKKRDLRTEEKRMNKRKITPKSCISSRNKSTEKQVKPNSRVRGEKLNSLLTGTDKGINKWIKNS